jgi:hypothetical protein
MPELRCDLVVTGTPLPVQASGTGNGRWKAVAADAARAASPSASRRWADKLQIQIPCLYDSP